MIKINLSPTKASGEILNLGGFDLSHLNVKMLFLSILILYVPEIFIEKFYDQQITQVKSQEQTLRRTLRKTRTKVRSLDNIKKQVEALKKQEEVLAQRLKTVKVIIAKRRNPFKTFHYLAKNIPKSVWLSRIEAKDKKLILIGNGENWKDIGIFLENLKNSIFLSNIKYEVPQGAKPDYQGKKVEAFQIETDIVRFE